MTKREQLLTILRVAEDGLARLAAEAGIQRAYADAAALLEAARRVQQVGEQTLLESRPAIPVDPVNTELTPTPVSAKNSPAVDRTGATKKHLKDAYPKFFRDGQTLVKVGWSKSEGAEYEHKCPKRAVDVLVGECARVGGPGKRFVMDTLLPLSDPDSKAEIPGYQAYVALAFLRHASLIDQHGRSGYSIPKPKSLLADTASAWDGSKSR